MKKEEEKKKEEEEMKEKKKKKEEGKGFFANNFQSSQVGSSLSPTCIVHLEL